MKKRHIKLLMLLFGISFSTSLNAQFETSFEQDEGYSTNPFFSSLVNSRDGQWRINRGHTDNAVTSDDQAATGDQSIKIGIENCSTLASFYSTELVGGLLDDKTVEFKLFIPSAPATHTRFSVYTNAIIGFNGPTFNMIFDEDKLKITEIDFDNQTSEDVDTPAVITRDTWMNFKAEIKYGDRKVLYYLDDVQVYEQILSPNNGFDFDNLGFVSESEGVVFIDDLKITALTLNVAENEFSSNFTLYPNPTNGEITL